MVDVRYKGQNYIMFGKIKISNGVNSIAEDDFYRLMRTPLFKYRIEKGVFSVPLGTLLEKPKVNKMENTTEKVTEKVKEKQVEKPIEKVAEKPIVTIPEKDPKTRFDEIK